jgi:hypothetical protein
VDDTFVKLDEREVHAAHFFEELVGDPFAFDPDRVASRSLRSSTDARFAERFLDDPPSIISASTACNRQIARVRAAVSW